MNLDGFGHMFPWSLLFEGRPLNISDEQGRMVTWVFVMVSHDQPRIGGWILLMNDGVLLSLESIQDSMYFTTNHHQKIVGMCMIVTSTITWQSN